MGGKVVVLVWRDEEGEMDGWVDLREGWKGVIGRKWKGEGSEAQAGWRENKSLSTRIIISENISRSNYISYLGPSTCPSTDEALQHQHFNTSTPPPG